MQLCHDLEYVQHKLKWMRTEQIWPNGLRYLWTDAFGVVLLASLARTFTKITISINPRGLLCVPNAVS